MPLLLGMAAIQIAHVPRLQRYTGTLRYALRWGLAGLLVASYRAYDDHKLGLTLTLLAALAGFSLLVLLESWQDRKPQRNAAVAAASPDWSELALAPIGPADTLIELAPPHWRALEGDGNDELPPDITRLGTGNYRVGTGALIKDVEAQFSVAPGKGWLAWHMAARRGVVLYDRARGVQYRLRGWQLYGWHVDEAWLSRSDDQPPSALSHVLGQDQREE
ncbi:hypothetical protein [Dyella monticola]|uniref:hypothetical protein n=1 Tax=Dyella monticola TaxID=1927958 RepID=UPI0011C062C3|nr:hypothetical protein [Dyella monticola]